MKARIEIRQWLARKNNLPRVADVELIERTAKAIHVSGHVAFEATVVCGICKRQLTDPISQITGIGPICCDKYNIPRYDGATDAELAEFKATLKRETEFETWLPISQLEACDVDLNDVPRKGRDEETKEEAGAGDLTSLEYRTGVFGVTQWIAGQKGFGQAVAFHGKVKRATEKAILLKVDYYLAAIEGKEIRGQSVEELARDCGMKIEEWDGQKVARFEIRATELWLPTSQITSTLVREQKPRKAKPATPARKLVCKDYEPETVKVTANGHYGDEMPWD